MTMVGQLMQNLQTAVHLRTVSAQQYPAVKCMLKLPASVTKSKQILFKWQIHFRGSLLTLDMAFTASS